MALRSLDPSIVNAYQAPKFNMPDPLQDAVAIAQLKNAQMLQQIRSEDLEKANEAKTFLTDISSKIQQAGGPENIREAFPPMLTHPNEAVRKVGAEIQKRLDLIDRQENYFRAHPGKVQVGNMVGPEGQQISQNNLAPQLGAAPTNSLIPEAFQQNLKTEMENADRKARYWEVESLKDPAFVKQAEDARKYANSLREIKSFEQNRLVLGPGGASMLTPSAPAAPSALSKLLAERDSLPANDPRRKIYDAEILKQTTHPAPVNVNVSTEKQYGGALAGALAKSDVDLRDAALNAPEAAGNANRILEVLSSGNIIAGPGAEWKLKTAKLLNASGVAGFVGKDNTELISNTEQLQKSLASQTLDSIKTSGLGAGAGFTNADRDFLEKAKSGNIDMTPETLRRTAELARRSAEATAEKWNTRVKQIPKSAVEGTGLSVEPVGLPSKFEARKTMASQPVITATNPKTGERIESSDGGQTWNPVGSKK
jgi:hypothetical protein